MIRRGWAAGCGRQHCTLRGRRRAARQTRSRGGSGRGTRSSSSSSCALPPPLTPNLSQHHNQLDLEGGQRSGGGGRAAPLSTTPANGSGAPQGVRTPTHRRGKAGRSTAQHSTARVPAGCAGTAGSGRTEWIRGTRRRRWRCLRAVGAGAARRRGHAGPCFAGAGSGCARRRMRRRRHAPLRSCTRPAHPRRCRLRRAPAHCTFHSTCRRSWTQSPRCRGGTAAARGWEGGASTFRGWEGSPALAPWGEEQASGPSTPGECGGCRAAALHAPQHPSKQRTLHATMLSSVPAASPILNAPACGA